MPSVFSVNSVSIFFRSLLIHLPPQCAHKPKGVVFSAGHGSQDTGHDSPHQRFQLLPMDLPTYLHATGNPHSSRLKNKPAITVIGIRK